MRSARDEARAVDRLRIAAGSAVALLLVACTGESALQFDPGFGPGTPLVAGVARYEDRDLDGAPGAPDVLVVPFTTGVVLRGASVLDFALPVVGDSFGTGATLTQGPAANEVTIVLGDGASLKTRQVYDPATADLHAASGIDLQAVLAPDAIENPVDGSDAAASSPIDVAPGFVDSGQRLGNDPTRAVALGDLDGDGDLDQVEGNFGRPSRAWLNDGSGIYPAAAARELGTSSTRALLLLDVDGDADLDLLVGNAAPEADELWRNDGAGALELAQVFGACDTWAFAAADLDGDGDPDLVAADGEAPNVVWENREGLFFFREELSDESTCPGSDTVSAGCPTRDVALADLDRDGELDLVEGNWEELDLVRLGEDGSFQEPVPIGLERGATSSLALGDLDLDGDADLVTGDGRAADRVWINAGGSVADSGQRLGREATADVALADVDQDGALDLVAAVRGRGNRFWLNDRTGRFVDSRQSLGTARTASLVLGDVDGDGDVDLVAGNENGANAIWLQSLAGTWGAATLVPALPSPFDPGGSRGIAAADLDLDDDVDLVLARGLAGGEVWHGDGDGNFALVQLLSPDIDSRAIAVGDIDGDGLPELIESQAGDTTAASPKPDRIWLADGTGTFVLGEDVTLDNDYDPRVVALVDVDSDGDLDYVLTDEPGTRPQCPNCGTRVLTNAGGEFTDTGQNLNGGDTTPPGVRALAVGDVDANGLPDLFQTGAPFATNGGQVWLNGVGANGAGTFSEGQTIVSLAGEAAFGLALGDLDGDGDLDLVSTDADGGGNHVWLNVDGTGSFVESTQRLADTSESAFGSVVLTDLERDGDLDVVAGGSSQLHAVFANHGAALFGPAAAVESSGSGAFGLAAADFDRDGDVDVVAALVAGAAEVWLNR
jgi:hypothetical protein